ncbi:rRNA pseudouridine synthase [Diaphorobacter sp. HDW4A]|uniref:pseudouridine synthase n=1 Tax=Diaphorobacter sp. HDW4A TaxID=2714924 RepID=UPI00140A610D|nr:pseudouridine synthase [Diaphorobacter sp. HDW4A]QIL81968.1 rRNA pseudouridine synthase [Diaphorobacter sp. HDW4A]
MPDKPSSQKPAADASSAPAAASARPRLALKPSTAKAAAPAASRGPARAPAPSGLARSVPAGYGNKPAFEPKPRGNTWTAPANGASAVRQPPPVIRKEPTDKIRLNKRMADQGMCSRREADDWIANGWVRVNGVVAEMGLQVGPEDRVEVDRRAQGQQEQQVTILLHKPMGYVSGQAEDGHTPAVALINPRTHWREDTSRTRFSPGQLRGIAPCGRLDIDSVGLLVLTQDGRVARQLIGEDSAIDKEYLVRVIYEDREKDVRSVFPEEKLALLNHGLSLDGKALKPAKVDWQNPEQLRFVLIEGKKRQIRRMCEQVGLKVVGLKRIRIGRVTLGNLPVGEWRYLGASERFE